MSQQRSVGENFQKKWDDTQKNVPIKSRGCLKIIFVKAKNMSQQRSREVYRTDCKITIFFGYQNYKIRAVKK